MMLTHPEHSRSLQIANQLYEYDDFMASVASVLDLGCGQGHDLEWWATRTTRDESPQPLNIRCTGIDIAENLALTRKYNNVFYQSVDFESDISPTPLGYDVLWCSNSFQYAQSPLPTLSKWWHLASPGGMLCLTVPQSIKIHHRRFDYYLPSGCFYHHTLVSLMHMLAMSGWDCNAGFFQQLPGDPWICAIVYKSDTAPKNPKNVTWYDLADSGLLPDSACASIQAHGYLRQQDLVLPWVDKSIQSLAQL